MHQHGCAQGGAQSLDASGFSGPLPWVGLYAAAASAACALAMASDAVSALRRRQLWFPSFLFSLNATTLTLLSVATKLPLDLSSPMPSRPDQLAKLSGSCLVATATANLLPSLASAPDAASAAADLIALAILVITVAANVSIQIATGVIYTFVPEHLAVLVLALALVIILCSSALAVPTTKRLLEEQFDDKFGLASDPDGGHNFDINSLRESVKRYWLMAHTSSPQYVLGRTATCTASGAFGLLTCLILVEASMRSVIKDPHGMSFCSGTSDYQWSTTVVFFSQVVAVVVGTIAPAWRWFNAVSFRGPFQRRWSCRDEVRVERYWIQRLIEWKQDASSTFLVDGSHRSRKMVHELKNVVLVLLTRAQIVVVVICKVVRLASVLPTSWIRRCCKWWSLRWGLVSIPSSLSTASGATRTPSGLEHLSNFVLHLEGEEHLVNLMMRSEREDTERWIRKGTKNQPAHLIQLLSNHATFSQGFQGVCEFDNRSIPSLVTDEPPNCWELPLVTLTTVAVALPYIKPDLVKSLRCAVNEGLRYVRLVDEYLDTKGLHNMRKAGDNLWLRVDLYDKWLDKDLHELVSEEKSGKKIIEKLEEISKECVSSFEQKMRDGTEERRNPLEWPADVFASNSMYRVSSTILQEYDSKFGTDDKLFLWLQTIISDIFCACLTNIPRVIYMECICSSVEVREKRVREAAFLLGEAKSILEILGNPEVTCFYPKSKQYIEDWCMTRQDQNLSLPLSSS